MTGSVDMNLPVEPPCRSLKRFKPKDLCEVHHPAATDTAPFCAVQGRMSPQWSA